MTQHVIAQNGSSVSVATTSDIGNAANLAAATTTSNGVVKKMTFTAQLTAAPTQADFNALLTKMIAAGLMASS